MAFNAQNFDEKLPQWQEWQNMPWNHLFYSIARRNLMLHISEQTLHALDVGGGNGADSLYLASLGHRVALVDFSAAMLDDARARAAMAGLDDRITFHQAEAHAIPTLFPGEQFDLALCHNILHFVEDAQELVGSICAILRPGGLLSLIETNRYSETMRVAIQINDLPAALQAVAEKQRMHTWFNVPEQRFSAEEMIGMLNRLGCRLEGQYGVRCVCDYLSNEKKTDPAYYADLERLEAELTSTYPYYLLARYFQIIARKTE
ncbi:MAG: methyltransferase domain-containing protein [Anaerolineales bacterium]|nr:methyltransferase domain-containing protein [Anaerolineales bacterium]